MRFFTVAVTALAAGNTLAMPSPQVLERVGADLATVNFSGQKVNGVLVAGPDPADPSLATRELVELEKRQAIGVAVGIVVVGVAARVAQLAGEFAAEQIKNLGKWTEAREQFTRKTTAEMWARNPDRNRFPAVACYNKGYRLQNPKNIGGIINAKMSLGVLNTDYDCMYISAPNQFYTDGDGGFINLSYTYNPNRCSFDKATGDLTCR